MVNAPQGVRCSLPTRSRLSRARQGQTPSVERPLASCGAKREFARWGLSAQPPYSIKLCASTPSKQSAEAHSTAQFMVKNSNGQVLALATELQSMVSTDELALLIMDYFYPKGKGATGARRKLAQQALTGKSDGTVEPLSPAKLLLRLEEDFPQMGDLKQQLDLTQDNDGLIKRILDELPNEQYTIEKKSESKLRVNVVLSKIFELLRFTFDLTIETANNELKVVVQLVDTDTPNYRCKQNAINTIINPFIKTRDDDSIWTKDTRLPWRLAVALAKFLDDGMVKLVSHDLLIQLVEDSIVHLGSPFLAIRTVSTDDGKGVIRVLRADPSKANDGSEFSCTNERVVDEDEEMRIVTTTGCFEWMTIDNKGFVEPKPAVLVVKATIAAATPKKQKKLDDVLTNPEDVEKLLNVWKSKKWGASLKVDNENSVEGSLVVGADFSARLGWVRKIHWGHLRQPTTSVAPNHTKSSWIMPTGATEGWFVVPSETTWAVAPGTSLLVPTQGWWMVPTGAGPGKGRARSPSPNGPPSKARKTAPLEWMLGPIGLLAACSAAAKGHKFTDNDFPKFLKTLLEVNDSNL